MIKRIRSTGARLTLAVLAVVMSTGSVQAATQWIEDLEEGKKLALKQNKLLLVDFWAIWCGPCRQMDADVWDRPDIGATATKFICVRVDVDRQNGLGAYYGVRGIPAMVFLNGYGEKLLHVTGYRPHDMMKQLMDAMPEDFSKAYEILGNLRRNGEDGRLRIKLGDCYRTYGLFEFSNDEYIAAQESQEVKDDPILMDKIETLMGINHLVHNNPTEAIRSLERCLKRTTLSPNRPLQLMGLALANKKLSKDEKVRGYVETLMQEFPENEYTAQAAALVEGK